MPIAADYPFMGIFWSMLIFMAFFLWIWIAITIFSDIFRRHDIGGFAKAVWIIFIIFIPWLGALVYLIAQHDGMAERNARGMADAQVQFDQRVRETVAASGPAGEIQSAQNCSTRARSRRPSSTRSRPRHSRAEPGMSTQPPQDPQQPGRDIAPPGFEEPPRSQPTAEPHGHAGPWILGAALVLVLGAIAAVLIHDAGTSDTQTVITRSPTVNTTTVQRSGPTITQATTTVNPATTTVTAPTKTSTVTQPPKTVTVTPPESTTQTATP